MSGDQPFVWNKGKCPFCGEHFADMDRHLHRQPFCAKKSKEHDAWCWYRETGRTAIRVIGDEISGAIKTEGDYVHADGTPCNSGRVVDFVTRRREVLLVCGHNLLVFKESSQ